MISCIINSVNLYLAAMYKTSNSLEIYFKLVKLMYNQRRCSYRNLSSV